MFLFGVSVVPVPHQVFPSSGQIDPSFASCMHGFASLPLFTVTEISSVLDRPRMTDKTLV